MRESDAQGSAVCDLKAALVRLAGDVELLQTLISVFHEDAPNLLQQLEVAMDRRDLRSIERAAHSLKGLAANFDGFAARDAAFVIEQMARDSALGGLKPAVEVLHKEIKRLREELDRVEL